MITSYSLLDRTVHGVPSGNYDGSSMDFDGNTVKAANYYQGLGDLQTVIIRVQEFKGIIRLRGSLETSWQAAMWFETEEFRALEHPETGVFTFSIRGNFVWMKAEIIGFSEGTIESITISY